jgi:virginiamycin B lyase
MFVRLAPAMSIQFVKNQFWHIGPGEGRKVYWRRIAMSLLPYLSGRANGKKTRQPRSRRARLSLEHLEDRCVPTTITELSPLPTANAAPTGITTAHDGSIWFTEMNANKVARMSTTGILTEYAVPTAGAAPQAITATPDGNLWFTELNGRKIGRINEAGGPIAEFALPNVAASEFPTAITTRSDGSVWFGSNQQPNVARVGKISSTGVITEVPRAQTASYITGIVGGPDGNLWLTIVSKTWGDSVAKLNTAGWGTFTNYLLPPGAHATSITVGSDSSMWFTEQNTNQIGHITTTGLMVQYNLAAGAGPQQIVAGASGTLWFTEKSGNKIGRITTTGAVTEYAVPTAGSQPYGITLGLDGNLWFTEQNANKLGKVLV